jgi:hypothetical protein
MAKRDSTVLLKRSNVPGKVPTILQLGELALNIADVKLYASGTTENDIVQIGWDKISRTGDTVTGNFAINGNLNATSLSATTYQNLPFNISGSTNSISVFTSSNVLGNSIISQSISGITVSGTTRITTVNNGVGDFLTRDSNGVITRRTSSEVLTDIGAQAFLTNPVTGTGANGQISFWTGTNTQSGDNGLFWDSTNKRLGIGTTTPNVQLEVSSTATIGTLRVNSFGDVFNNGANQVSSNCFFGSASGRNATATSNTLFGNNTGQNLTTGGNNTIVGNFAGAGITTQSNNTFIGRSAGTNIASAAVVAIGNDSGRFQSNGANLTQSPNGVFIGHNTRAAGNNQTNQIVIGHDAIGNGANTATLGNLSVLSTFLRGDVAIANELPIARLHIRGAGSTSATTALRVENSNGIASIQVSDHGLLQHTSNSETRITVPTEVYRFAASLGNTFKMMYTVQEDSNIRGGEYLCVHDGRDVNTVHTFPTEFGDTSGIDFTLTITSDDIIITADVTSGSWVVKLSVQIL